MAKEDTIVYLSTFPPRECGIATFTQDLSAAMDKQFNPTVKSKIAAINESPTSFYNYPSKVFSSIASTNLRDYIDLAKKIDTDRNIKIVNIQHEFGIFEGTWGDYLISFLKTIQKPVVITLHSVIPNPEDRLRHTVQSIDTWVKAIVVMNEYSKQILESQYGIPASKIFLIPHGIPQVPFRDCKDAKEELGLHDRIVLSTFGMLSENKGIEYAIRALPTLIKKFPEIIYLVIGATHPVVRKREGESYRNFLVHEVEKLKLKNHVKFYNRYLGLEEIIEYLKATDIYICTTTDSEQSVSGTLAYALGCGRAVVSTPTQFAQYILTKKNGILVNFRDSESLGHSLNLLLSDKKLLQSMHKNAYQSTRHMTWSNVAAAYFRLYKKYADLRTEEWKFPEIKLDHLVRLTDDFGIFQHARYNLPAKRFGYSLDDVARALIVCTKHYRMNRGEEMLQLIRIYLRFMQFAQRTDGSFANIISYQGHRDDTVEDDVQGRALWALGYTVSCDFLPEKIRDEAEILLKRALKHTLKIRPPRATAFTMIGLYFYLQHNRQKRLHMLFKKLADRQVALYRSYSSPDWQWFEHKLTYSNSKLPESLFYAYALTRTNEYLEVAEKTLAFLKAITFRENHYSPIGEAGWYHKDKKRAHFDQQPEDTASMVETKIVAYKITKDAQHLRDAREAFQWFLGRNHLQQVVYDEITGGCHDGLGRNTLNLNQGAESTISYLMARLAFEDEEIKRNLGREPE